MSQFDFDTVIDRRGTGSLKFDFAQERGRPADVLPLWVADMDFKAPPTVLEALRRRVDHGIFGYSDVKEDYVRAVSGWFRDRFGWQPQPQWLVRTPGVVYALAMAVRALTEPGDAVLVTPPVYYPFFSVVRDNGRRLVQSVLREENGHYEIDFADFEEKIGRESVKLFLLCSPHNPVGRVWREDELRRIGEICRRHGVFVVSDEIHCDFAFEEHPHRVFLEVNPELADSAIVCTAPSKTFNLAGLQVSNIFIPGERARAAFCREIDRTGYSQLNALGLVACQAAYETGAPWLDACRAALRSNLDFLRAFLKERIPQIRLIEPEGTYFAWLDCSGLGLDRRALEKLVVSRARLWLDAGAIFGGGAEQFERVVLACPRQTLEQALTQLADAVEGLGEARKDV